ncbi:hypothetical protein TWF718_008224 [Orbilia javanica]|uniref:Uncharacterized protein n=1 Tax=Orbilia javanica TaxID=47235 RepID=A0AAN8MR79_9PEZI
MSTPNISLSRSLEILKRTGFTAHSGFLTYSPIDFFHPSVMCDKSFEHWLGHPYPKLDPAQIHHLLLSYLCENEYTYPESLSNPPRNIEVLVDTCSYVFSSRITSQFKQDMESLCASYGENTKEEGGVAQTLFACSGETEFNKTGATLEEWFAAMVDMVCNDYNRKMEMTKMAVTIRAAGVIEKRSLWEGVKGGFMKALRMGNGVGLKERKGLGVAAWVYSHIKKSRK